MNAELFFLQKEDPKPEKSSYCVPTLEQIPGHTGFLTFATLPPFFIRSASTVIQQPIENVKVPETGIENVVIDSQFVPEEISMQSMSDEISSDL